MKSILMNKRAHTLIELVVSMILFSVIAAAATQLIALHLGYQKVTDSEFKLQQQSIIILNYMAKGIRNSESADIVNNNTLQLKNRDGYRTAEYQISGSNLVYKKYSNVGALISTTTLSDKIDSLIFRDRENPGNTVHIRVVEFDLSLTETVADKVATFDISSAVFYARQSKVFEVVALVRVADDVLISQFNTIQAAIDEYETAEYNPVVYEIRCMGNTAGIGGDFDGVYPEALEITNSSITIKGSYNDDAFTTQDLLNTPSVINLANQATSNGLKIELSNDDNVIFDGFTVENNNNGKNGSGVYAEAGLSSSITLSNCIIQNNVGGGWGFGGAGVYAEATGNSSISISNSVIRGNNNAPYGGGIYALLSNGSSLTISDNTINNNLLLGGGAYGSGVYVNVSSASTANIIGNSINTNGDSQNGGGIHATINGSDSSFFLTNNTILENITTGHGGGVHIISTNGPTLNITNNLIAENSAMWASEVYADLNGGSMDFRHNEIRDGVSGGGVSITTDSTIVDIYNNFIHGNKNIISGSDRISGGLKGDFNSNSVVTIANNLIVKNKCEANGGGAYLTSNNSTLYIENNTIADNEITGWGIGTGLHVTNTSSVSIDLRNNIIYGNIGPPYPSPINYVGPDTNDINYCDINQTLTGGGILNIDSNPGFVNKDADDYTLSTAGPCINSGDPAILDPDNSKSDMGCYGGPGSANPIGR